MSNIKVAVWGFGAMGSGITRTLLSKEGVDIVGVCDNHPDRMGKSIYDVLELDPAGREDVIVTDDINNIAITGKCDICVIITDSFVSKIFDKVMLMLNKKVNVITIAEEMAYPIAKHPELSKKMDEAAKENGVSVLGTGINPGLVMDLLAICLSGCMSDVESVTCRRINSLSPFGKAVMEEQGVGVTAKEFEDGIKDGSIAGHVGFAESVGMISDALCLGVDKFEQSMEPIITDVDRKSPYGEAKAGNVAGVDMKGAGYRGDQLIITMEHPQQIEPEDVGVMTGDFIELKGTQTVTLNIQPEINGGLGTIAMCVNCIPHVINARPGLRTMIDIPVPHAIMGDFSQLIDPDKKLVK